MKKTFLKTIGTMWLAILMLATFTQISVSAQDKNNEEENSAQTQEDLSRQPRKYARSLEGSWSVLATVRNCQTGDAIRTIPRMNTFMQGGTMQEFAAAGPPSLRGPGHGVWSHLSERRFSYAVQFFRFNADGSFAGSVRERRNVEVSRFGSFYNATGTGEIFDANGNLILAVCATETATRFE
jgi:hypothetical protein